MPTWYDTSETTRARIALTAASSPALTACVSASPAPAPERARGRFRHGSRGEKAAHRRPESDNHAQRLKRHLRMPPFRGFLLVVFRVLRIDQCHRLADRRANARDAGSHVGDAAGDHQRIHRQYAGHDLDNAHDEIDRRRDPVEDRAEHAALARLVGVRGHGVHLLAKLLNVLLTQLLLTFGQQRQRRLR